MDRARDRSRAEHRLPIGIITLAFCLLVALLSAASAPAATTTFSNPGAISIPTEGTATPYPSNIAVSSLNGSITKVTATLNGFSHGSEADVDALLVGPGGQSVILMSDAGCTKDSSGVNLTFDDAAAGPLPIDGDFASGSYTPTDYDSDPTDDCSFSSAIDNETLPGPAPGGPYGTTLSVFNGASADGTWSLYINDDQNGDVGSIAGGWSLTITGPEPVSPPAMAPAAAQDPKCARLGKKLKRQKRNLKRRHSKRKKKQIAKNRNKTLKRLRELGC